MSAETPVDMVLDVAGVVVPCGLIAIALATDVPWWLSAVLTTVAIAGYARLAGWERATLASLVATAGMVLVVEREGSDPVPERAAEFGVMAVLILVSNIFGWRRVPLTDPPTRQSPPQRCPEPPEE